MALQRNDNWSSSTTQDLYQVSGSAHWANMSDTALVVHRDFEDNSTKSLQKGRARRIWSHRSKSIFHITIELRYMKR